MRFKSLRVTWITSAWLTWTTTWRLLHMFNTALILHHSLCFTLFALCWFTSPSSLVLWLLPHCMPFSFHKLSSFVILSVRGQVGFLSFTMLCHNSLHDSTTSKSDSIFVHLFLLLFYFRIYWCKSKINTIERLYLKM